MCETRLCHSRISLVLLVAGAVCVCCLIAVVEFARHADYVSACYAFLSSCWSGRAFWSEFVRLRRLKASELAEASQRPPPAALTDLRTDKDTTTSSETARQSLLRSTLSSGSSSDNISVLWVDKGVGADFLGADISMLQSVLRVSYCVVCIAILILGCIFLFYSQLLPGGAQAFLAVKYAGLSLAFSIRELIEVRRLTASVGLHQRLTISEWWGRTGGNNRSTPPFNKCFQGNNILPDTLAVVESFLVLACHFIILDVSICDPNVVDWLNPPKSLCFAHWN